MSARVVVVAFALILAFWVPAVSAETLIFTFADPPADAWGCSPTPCTTPFASISGTVTDAIGLFVSFDNQTGDYSATVIASPANPFIGIIRLNVNLFNATRAQFFFDNVNDFLITTPTTSLTVTGQDAQLLTWQAGDAVAACQGAGGIVPETCLGPLGAPMAFASGVINFSSSLFNTPIARDHFGSSPPATILTVNDYGQSLLSALINDVVALNLQTGISNAFDSKLGAVIAAIDDAKNQNDVAAVNAIHAFINAVEAQRGKQLTQAAADHLVSAAQRIIALLE